MPTLLAIHSYPKARDTVWQHWPFYKSTGWRILGVDCVNGHHPWPENNPSVGIAYDRYWDKTDNLVRKLIGTFEFVLNEPSMAEITDICIIEHDAIFIRHPPRHPGGLMATLSGHWDQRTGVVTGCPQTRSYPFYHTPWWADRETAQIIVNRGHEMIANRDTAMGAPDFFIGMLATKHGLKFTPANTWSVNSGDFESRKDSLPDAIRRGVFYIHGLKTMDQLKWVMQQVKLCDEEKAKSTTAWQ